MAREFTPAAEILKDLAEGEQIIWNGAPEAFPLVDDKNKKSLLGRWIGCIIAAVVIIVGYLLLNANVQGGVTVWLMIILLLVVVYLAGLPVIDMGNVYKKAKYYVTNRRVILHFADKEIHSLPLTGLKTAFVNAGEGLVHVELGSCVGISDKKRRVAGFHPRKSDNGNVTGLVFYNLEDSAKLRELF